jgi:hypothetical protein
MSSLNNKYGVSNGCPAIMNDGRGVNTEFRSNRLLTQELRKSFNSKSTHDFRIKLQQLETPKVEDITKGFVCTSVPGGLVVFDKEIRLGQSSSNTELSNRNNGFVDPINLVEGTYHTYNFSN